MGMLRRQREGHGATPIMADHEQTRLAQDLVHQTPHIASQGLFIVAAHQPWGVAERTQVGRDDAMVRGQPGNDVPPHEPGLRYASGEGRLAH